MTEDLSNLPFSQRTGLAPVPPQLQLGEVSNELRRLIYYSVKKEFDRFTRFGGSHSYFDERWRVVANDMHVIFFEQSPRSFENSPFKIEQTLERLIARTNLAQLFDLVEFLAKHPDCSSALKSDLADVFVRARAAYRLIGEQIVAIGTEEQGVAVEKAIGDAEVAGVGAARRHLISAGAELRTGNWANSVRESIHAVEAIARKIDPDANTLGPALKKLEQNGYIHGSLKSGFEKLYGYTNDERGIRHALSEEEARVDEVDALFMLGACASFVSYLISKNTSQQEYD